MSLLLRLLTNGKSLVGLRDDVPRYRLVNQNLLPRFGSAQNPFQRVTHQESVPGEGGTLNGLSGKEGASNDDGHGPGIPESAAPEHADTSTGAPGSAAYMHTAQLAPIASVPEPKGVPGFGGLRRLSSWLSPTDRRPAQTAAPSIKVPVQCELSLERVQVVRNDLSDADLEIVSLRSSQRSAPASGKPSAKPLAGMPGRMAQATTRLLSALKT
jgi:hypothetical protein